VTKQSYLLYQQNTLVHHIKLNQMELKVRALEESDLEILQSWWKAWKWPEVNRDTLPANGLGGLMIHKDDTPIISGFLYLTNSNIAWIEWIISNPQYRDKDRKQALRLLITSLEDVAIKQGYKSIFTVVKNNSLIKAHKDLGYSIDESPSYEISKKIL
jgi:hypothetical protein